MSEKKRNFGPLVIALGMASMLAGALVVVAAVNEAVTLVGIGFLVLGMIPIGLGLSLHVAEGEESAREAEE